MGLLEKLKGNGHLVSPAEPVEWDSIKVDLSDGHWALIAAEIKHRTQRLQTEVTRKAMKATGGLQPVVTLTEELKASIRGGGLEIDMSEVDWTAVNDIMAVNQTVAWSFGPVTEEVYDNIPDRYTAELIEAMNGRYGLDPLPGTGDGN
jgi:hypothetical protein